MKGLDTLFIVTLLAVTNLPGQTLSRYTTGELLNKIKANATASYSNADLNKGLLYLGYTEIDKKGFSRNKMFGMSSMYLVELNSPSRIQLTRFHYQENY